MTDQDIRRRLDRFMTQVGEDRGRYLESNAITGLLLTGKARLLGKPVELVWPEGLPERLTEDELRDLGEKMLEDS